MKKFEAELDQISAQQPAVVPMVDFRFVIVVLFSILRHRLSYTFKATPEPPRKLGRSGGTPASVGKKDEKSRKLEVRQHCENWY